MWGECVLIMTKEKCANCNHSISVHDWGGRCWSKYDGMSGDGGCDKFCEDYVEPNPKLGGTK